MINICFPLSFVLPQEKSVDVSAAASNDAQTSSLARSSSSPELIVLDAPPSNPVSLDTQATSCPSDTISLVSVLSSASVASSTPLHLHLPQPQPQAQSQALLQVKRSPLQQPPRIPLLPLLIAPSQASAHARRSMSRQASI